MNAKCIKTRGAFAGGPLAPDARAWLRHCFTAPAPPLAGMLLAATMAHGCGLLVPLGYQVVFDRVFTQGVEATLIVVVIALCGLALIEGACQGLRARYRLIWGDAVDARLRPGLLARLVQQEPTDEAGTTPFLQAARLRASVCGPLVEATLDLPLLILLHGLLAWLAPACGAMALALGILLLLVHRFSGERGLAPSTQEPALREVQSLAQAVVEGAPGWRALRVAQGLVAHFAALDAAARATARAGEERLSAGRECVQTLLRLQAVLLLGIGAHEVLAGRLGGGGLVACNLLAARMAQPWTRVLAGLDALPQARRSRAALLGLLQAPVLPVASLAHSQQRAGGGCEHEAPMQQQLRLDAFLSGGAVGGAGPAPLTGRWPPGTHLALLTDLPELRARTFAACVGEAESGGSASLAAATGPSIPLAECAIGIAGGFALVPGSLRANLGLHDMSLTEQQLFEALADAGLGEWVDRLPAGLDSVPDATWPLTRVEFRLALGLARALLRQPRVLVWELSPAQSRAVVQAGLFERLARQRPALTLILVGGDPSAPPHGFHMHWLTVCPQRNGAVSAACASSDRLPTRGLELALS